MKRAHWVFLGVWLLLFAWFQGREAQGLGNPLTAGKNIIVQSTATPTKVPVTASENCAVGFEVAYFLGDGGVNSNTNCVICSGYQNDPGDGGIGLNVGNCFGHICTDSTKCAGTLYVRDTAPGAIYHMKGNIADGTTCFVRIELGKGCKSP